MKENTTKSNRLNLPNLLGDLWSEGSIEFPVKVLRWRLDSKAELQELGDAIYNLFENFYIIQIERNRVDNDDDDWFEGFIPDPRMYKNGEAGMTWFDKLEEEKKKEGRV